MGGNEMVIMRPLATMLALALCTALGAACDDGQRGDANSCRAPLGPGTQTTCTVAGGEYQINVPASVRTPAALVLDIHGLGGSGAQQRVTSGWNRKAAEQGFVVAYPEANGLGWNSQGRFMFGGSRDDVAFLKAVVRGIQSEISIDPAQIFTTGLSSGGQMSQALACEAADVFRASAPVSAQLAGGSQRTIVANCNPARGITVAHFHGLDDTIVPYNGGTLDNISAPASLNAWVSIQSCSTVRETQQISRTTSCEIHRGCDDGVLVTLCSISGGSHILYSDLAGPTIPDLAWDFFQGRR